MRDYHGTPYASVADTRTRDALSIIDYYLRDLSRGIHRISVGERPDGSGAPIPVGENGSLLDYLFLPGRTGGQTLHAVDTNPAFRILTTEDALQRWEKSGVAPLNLDAEDNGAATDYVFNTTVSGSGIQFRMNDATSGIRITSESSRAYIEAGTTAGSNFNLALTGFNGDNGNSRWSGFTYQALVTMVDSDTLAYDTRVGINLDPLEFSSSAASNQPDSLIIARRTSATSGVPTLSLPGASSTESALSIIAAPGGSLPTSRTLGSTRRLSLRYDGSIRWSISTLQESATGGLTGRLQMLDTASRNALDVRMGVSAFADTVTSTALLLSNAANESLRAIIAGDAGAVLARFGVCATSMVIGPVSTGTLPAPVSSRILTVVDSGATPRLTISSSGLAQFLGAGNASVLNTESVELNDDGDFVPSVYVKTGPSSGAPNYAFMTLVDLASGTFVTLAVDGSPAGSATLTVPGAGGVLITDSSTNTVVNKNLRVGTFGTVNHFVDRLDDTKLLNFNLANWSTSTTRNVEWLPLAGYPVISGNDPPAVAAGSLGIVNLTAQLAAIASTNLSNTPPVGFYLIHYELTTTTADATAGTVQLDVAVTGDGGAVTTSSAALDLTTANAQVRGTMERYLASGEIAYAVPVTGAVNNARFAVRIRVVALG